MLSLRYLRVIAMYFSSFFHVIFRASYTEWCRVDSLRKIHRSFYFVADLNGFCRLLQIYSITAPKKLNTRGITEQTNQATKRYVENLIKNLASKDLPSIGHVVSGSERHQMCIIGRGWHGDTTSAPCIYVTQLISELLKSVRCEGVIVIQNVIVCGSACSLRRNQ